MTLTWFVDGGAHRGESVHLARKIYGTPLGVVAIEPASECWGNLAALGVLVVPAALWTSMGHTKFYRGEHEVSSTLMAEKTTGGIYTDRAERVPTVTLESVLAGLPQGERTALKLDIEGAEYAVLEQALEAGALERVHDLYVDFHGGRLAGFSRERHVKLVEELLVRGFSLPKWIPGEDRVIEWGRRWISDEVW